jgi:hypothetical protein
MTSLHGGKGKFAIDAVYPYSRPLSEEEIKRHHLTLPIQEGVQWVVNFPSRMISRERVVKI